MLSTRNSPQIRGHIQTESERLENTFHGNRDKKKAGVAILIPDKTYFVIKIVIRDKERHYIMIKGSIKEEDIAIINIYAPNIGVPQHIRQMLANMKREINSNTIPGNFNTPLTLMDTSTKQKISWKTQAPNDTMDQLYLIDIYRAFHPKQWNSPFFLTLTLDILQERPHPEL